MSDKRDKRRSDLYESDENHHDRTKHSHGHKKKKHKHRKHKHSDSVSSSAVKPEDSLKVTQEPLGTETNKHRERTEVYSGSQISGNSSYDKDKYYKSRNVSKSTEFCGSQYATCGSDRGMQKYYKSSKDERWESIQSFSNFETDVKCDKTDIDRDRHKQHSNYYETQDERYERETEMIKSARKSEPKIQKEDNSSDSESELDFDFEFTQYKSDLNKIFFRDQDFIKR